MSATGKAILWTGGGALLGAAFRFLIVGKWTRAEVARHVGYAGFTSAAVTASAHWFEIVQSASGITLMALATGAFPVVARAALLTINGKVAAKVGGVEVSHGGGKDE